MPELPEVETIIRSLRMPMDRSSKSSNDSGLIGKVISQVQVLWPRSLVTPSVDQFQTQMVGQQILTIDRRGKYIRIKLNGKILLIHLRMSGDMILEAGVTERNRKHDRVILEFTDGGRLVFNDTRKFGRVWLVDDPETVTSSLGPEPLEEKLTPEIFYDRLHRVKRQIKPLLLDQTFIAGMGNIYTDEALFHAGIHPNTAANRLSEGQSTDLLAAIRKVLLEGIERNGASIDWVYRGGNFQNHFQVYQRDGQPCYRCGSIIERITVGQRGTHFCPHCQQRIA